MLKRLIDLRCDEVSRPLISLKSNEVFTQQEILRYLDHVKEFWSQLLHNDKPAMQKVDHATVKALERTAPSASLLDSTSLYDQIVLCF